MNTKIVIAIILVSFPGLIQAQEWFAIARHGECVVLSELTEKIELLKSLSTPSEIEDKLRKANVEYTIEPLFNSQEEILKLNVPSENLAMVLGRKQFCREFISK